MFSSILIFAIGSALCGAAPSMNFLIAGRGMLRISFFSLELIPSFFRLAAVQGLGGGGIASMTHIILSDLVPLQERGLFNGLIAM